MARIRSIKPEFFDDPDIAELSVVGRLLFIGLWTMADREGRLRDEPRRIKARLLPYDTDVDIEGILEALLAGAFIVRYQSGDDPVIQVTNFLRHQIPGRDEPPSEFLSPDGSASLDIGRSPNGTVRQRIYARDSYRCAYCDRDLAHDSRTRCVDHVVPLAQGGTHFDFNLVTACKPCNAKKGAKRPDECGMKWPLLTPHGPTVNTPLTGGLTGGPTPLTLKGQERYIGVRTDQGAAKIGQPSSGQLNGKVIEELLLPSVAAGVVEHFAMPGGLVAPEHPGAVAPFAAVAAHAAAAEITTTKSKATNGERPSLLVGERVEAPRKHKPVFFGSRFSVFDWQLRELEAMVGTDAFDVLGFLFELDSRHSQSGQVIPREGVWLWLQQQVLGEARRRGMAEMPMASDLSKASTRMMNSIARLEAEERAELLLKGGDE